jgi:sensor histidine kinase YesM
MDALTVKLTLGLWGLCLLTFTASISVATGGRFPLWMILWLAALTVAGLTGSLLLHALVRALGGWLSTPKWIVLTLAAFGTAGLQALFDSWMGDVLHVALSKGGHQPLDLEVLAFHCLLYFWLFGFYTATLELISTHEKASVHARRAAEYARQLAEARELARDTQLQMLRFQLNPHFLFNTLNNISSLVVSGRAQKAELMIEGLSRFLRASLAPAEDEFIPLSHELALTEAYLDIEAIRFAEPMDIEIDCPAKLENALVPSLILQPLVENAVKYALTPSKGRSRLRIMAQEHGEVLVLSVVDGGASDKSERSGSGIGLRNVARRIEVLYGQRGQMDARPFDGGFRAEVSLPLARRSAVSAA